MKYVCANFWYPQWDIFALISFVKKLITTKTMTFKNTQVAHVNKGDDKIVITQATNSTSKSPMTSSKEKSTYVFSKDSKRAHLFVENNNDMQ